MEYNEGERVKCVNVTDENHEKLELNAYYTIVGKTYFNGDVLYSVRNADGELTHTIDRFERVFGNNEEVLTDCDIPTCVDEISSNEAVSTICNDIVNHPSHYTQFKFEVIDVIEDVVKDLSGVECFCIANVIKYVMRYQFKNGVEDLKKARFYLDKAILSLEPSTDVEIQAMTKRQQGYIAGLTKALGLERTKLPKWLSPVADYHELTEVEAVAVIDKLLAIKEYNKMSLGYTE